MSVAHYVAGIILKLVTISDAQTGVRSQDRRNNIKGMFPLSNQITTIKCLLASEECNSGDTKARQDSTKERKGSLRVFKSIHKILTSRSRLSALVLLKSQHQIFQNVMKIRD